MRYKRWEVRCEHVFVLVCILPIFAPVKARSEIPLLQPCGCEHVSNSICSSIFFPFLILHAPIWYIWIGNCCKLPKSAPKDVKTSFINGMTDQEQRDALFCYFPFNKSSFFFILFYLLFLHIFSLFLSAMATISSTMSE